MKIQELTQQIFVSALKDEALHGTGDLWIKPNLSALLQPTVVRLQENIAKEPAAERIARVNVAAYLTLEIYRFGHHTLAAGAFGLALAKAWLQAAGYLAKPIDRAAEREILDALRGDPLTANMVDVVARAMRSLAADPLLLFIAAPITSATIAEVEMINDIVAMIRARLVPEHLRIYSAIEEADPRLHSDFADDPSWREHDDRWIRGSALVLILHTRAATGIGCVHDVARAAAVPVILAADKAVTPMLEKPVPADRRVNLNPTAVANKVIDYVNANRESLLDHRATVRMNLPNWRKGRLALKRSLAELSPEGLIAPAQTTLAKQRFEEILNDDHAFGSATDYERFEIRKLIGGRKLPVLNSYERAALDQASSNGNWSSEVSWEIELVGRELLAEGRENRLVISHHSKPTSPMFWNEIHDELFY